MQMGSRHAKHVGDRLHREGPFSSDTGCKLGFFCLGLGESFLRIFTSMVLRPSRRSSFASPLVEPANLRAADHRFIQLQGCHASLRHQAAAIGKAGSVPPHAAAPPRKPTHPARRSATIVPCSLHLRSNMLLRQKPCEGGLRRANGVLHKCSLAVSVRSISHLSTHVYQASRWKCAYERRHVLLDC